MPSDPRTRFTHTHTHIHGTALGSIGWLHREQEGCCRSPAGITLAHYCRAPLVGGCFTTSFNVLFINWLNVDSFSSRHRANGVCKFKEELRQWGILWDL